MPTLWLQTPHPCSQTTGPMGVWGKQVVGRSVGRKNRDGRDRTIVLGTGVIPWRM